MPSFPTATTGTFPRIAHEDSLATATLTASSEAPGFEVENVADWMPHSRWKPDSGTAWTIEAEWTSSRTITAWACYGHNLGDESGSIHLEYWNGSSWVDFDAGQSPGGTEVIYVVGAAAVTTTKVRWSISAASAAVEIGVLWAGQDLVLPIGLAPGWAPPHLAQMQTTRETISREGQFLGTSVDFTQAELSFTLTEAEESWVRSYWWPFKLACQTRPFFLHWNTATDPTYPAFCFGARFDSLAYSAHGYHRCGLSCKAVVE